MIPDISQENYVSVILNDSNSASTRMFGKVSLLNPNMSRKSWLEMLAKKLQFAS